jgi:iron complex outermembrane receptor protein
MSKAKALGGSSLVALLTMGLWTGSAAAALAQDEAANTEQEIVVTGSLIRGTPETTALPVDVITADELVNQGSPSTLELIKSLPVSQGVLGDTNQFDSRAQGSAGSGSVNLRGLGPQRTLVLLNGRRMVLNPFILAGSGGVDTNTIPGHAIGRIEVLKDGAAATYGSDAIGGVINFITRQNFEGFEVSGNYEFVDGSDGDYDVSGVWGWQGDQASLLVSVGTQHRSELRVIDRDWAFRPFAETPQGGWSAAGMPASFIPLAINSPAIGVARFVDPGCTNVDGATPGFSGPTPVCRWQYTQFDNLVELEDRYQVFTEFKVDLTETTEFHIDGLYAYTELPEWKTSPSYALLQGTYVVPANNPGLIDFVAANPGGVPGVHLINGPTVFTPGQIAPGLLFIAGRPYGFGGNPLYDNGPSQAEYWYEALRLSGGLTGEFDNGVGWDIALTYSEEEAFRSGRDTVVNRFQRALAGLGGPNCPLVGGTPGVGPCMFFNPFASGVPGNAISGVANPSYNPALGSNEDPELVNWFFPEIWTNSTSTLFVADLVLNGETGIDLGGGNIAWALGAQYRVDGFKTELSDINNLDVNPCINSIDFNNHVCAAPTGVLGFLGGAFEQDLSRDVRAVFGELNIPFSEAFEMQLAARYEDYSGETGSTFDPKVSVRWQLVDWLALRASAGSTFRGPPLTQLQPGSITALQDVLGTFRAIDIFGNPSLKPESANTYNAGAIVEAGGLTGTVDVWRFEFENPIITEPLGGMVATMWPNGLANTGNCGDPAFAALQARFTFGVGGCGPSNVTRVRTHTVNGPPIEITGVDLSVRYEWQDVLGGYFAIGGSGSYVHEYLVGATSVEGIEVSPAFDAVGFLNYQTQVVPVPQWKGTASIEWGNDSQNLRFAANYIDSYIDQRFGADIDSHLTFDANYRIDLPSNSTFIVSVKNFTDEDPPFARLDLNYDPFTVNPIGRTIRVGLRQRF